jgi:orotate phosphoribosyltransferase
MPYSKDEVIAILKQHQAMLEGHFVLASGKHSGHYVQVAMVTQFPHVLADLLKDKITEMKQKIDIDTILSAAVGGIPVGQQVALLSQCRSLFAERDEKNQLILKRNFSLNPDEKVLLVEDVVTTGGTLIELKKLVERHQAKVTGVFTVINRSGKDEWEGLPLETILAINFPVYPPNECPLCKEGIPAHRPGTKKILS